MKQPTSAEPVLREGLAYTIRLRDGRKITDTVYYACVASGKPYFAKGGEIYPAEEVVRHSIGGRNISPECRRKDESGIATGRDIQPAPSLIAQIKSMLRVLGTKELDMGLVENSSMALWWDNHGDSHETTVLAVGIDNKNDLYLTLDDDCGGDVQIWESCGQLSDNDLELVLENIREYMNRPVKVSFRELAERAFALPKGGTISFFCKESLDDYAWGITKTRQLDADLVIIGIYGGGMTFLYDLTGDPDAEELAGFLGNILSAFTPENVWIKP